MTKNSNHKLKPVPITNQTALRLIRRRARAEFRSLASAAALSIIEHLGNDSGLGNDNLSGGGNQDKI